MKEEYIANINQLLNECQDVVVLDFVYQFLQKRIAKTTENYPTSA